MITIREELADSEGFTDAFSLAALEALGIDPDLPAEWATVDRCLTWLRERWETPRRRTVIERYAGAGGWIVKLVTLDRDGLKANRQYDGPTLHAALIAACKAVQENPA
jgi:hypothetical protein